MLDFDELEQLAVEEFAEEEFSEDNFSQISVLNVILHRCPPSGS